MTKKKRLTGEIVTRDVVEISCMIVSLLSLMIIGVERDDIVIERCSCECLGIAKWGSECGDIVQDKVF